MTGLEPANLLVGNEALCQLSYIRNVLSLRVELRSELLQSPAVTTLANSAYSFPRTFEFYDSLHKLYHILPSLSLSSHLSILYQTSRQYCQFS